MEWLDLIVRLLEALVVIIPLVVALIVYVKKAIKEKNWDKLLALVMSLMQEAEGKFETGSEKKSWVLMAIKASSDTLNYEIDMDVVSKLIDDLCDMSKVVNAPVEE